MADFYSILKPLLFRLSPEKAHRLAIRFLRSGLAPKPSVPENPALRMSLWNRSFPNPVGLAAGFDKDAEAISALLSLGFGFVEAGTVTPKPQPGNPGPRIFRDIQTHSIINSMGFPSQGLEVFKKNYEAFLDLKPPSNGLVGLNIGMNKNQTDPVKDYKFLVAHLSPLADYIAINISSPNTPGLRDLQEKNTLMELVKILQHEREKACGDHSTPILLKLAPDLDDRQQEELAGAVIDAGVDGLILTNTTTKRPGSLDKGFASSKGGLSGPYLKGLSTGIIKNFYCLTEGKIPIIGVGGISNAADAYEKIKAGASLVQFYTVLAFSGPNVVCQIITGLENLLSKDGYTHISQAVGVDSGFNKEKKNITHAT
jgi:dihydroorotate dehydrogenase